MSDAALLEEASRKSQPFRAARNPALMLRRKCGCGGSPSSSVTGECESCKTKRLQTKLSIGASNDPLELEADRVADRVMSAYGAPGMDSTPPRIQRVAGESAGQAGTAPASIDRVLAGSGRPLDPVLRQDMVRRFGYDFSQVRIHTGTQAERSAREVSALAYTVGNNIVFGPNQFSPGSQSGRRLIAHELTHVVQQSGHSRAAGVVRRVGECSGRNGYNCNGVRCTTAAGRRGTCTWGGVTHGCNCRDNSSDEPGPSRVREMLPSWLLLLLSAAALAALAACFASGVCEFGIVVAGLGAAAAAAVIAILHAAGVRDSGGGGGVA
jgi:Domain of unknown function (DUF4157)